jgi:hypothetical protein
MAGVSRSVTFAMIRSMISWILGPEANACCNPCISIRRLMICPGMAVICAVLVPGLSRFKILDIKKRGWIGPLSSPIQPIHSKKKGYPPKTTPFLYQCPPALTPPPPPPPLAPDTVPLTHPVPRDPPTSHYALHSQSHRL